MRQLPKADTDTQNTTAISNHDASNAQVITPHSTVTEQNARMMSDVLCGGNHPANYKALRMIVDAPWYVPNTLIWRDLQIP
jgi:hypothetical protein